MARTTQASASTRPAQVRAGWNLGALAAAAVGVAAAGGIRVVGQRLRSRTEADLDDPLDPPVDVAHLHLPTADGGSLHVVDTGVPGGDPTRPVVLMHGVTLQWWVWAAVIRLLRPQHRVLAWDMRGHGESLAGSDGVTLEATARDLVMLIEELDLRDVVLVGHSMGGMTLGRLAADHHEFMHERVHALVFVASSAAPTSQAAIIGGFATLAGIAARTAGLAARRPRFTYPWHVGNLSAVLVSMAFGARPTARMIEDVRHMEAEMPSGAMAEAAASIATHDVRADLARVDLVSHVLVGSQDKLTPPIHARELAGLIERAELTVVDGIGHQIMQEQPSAVVDVVDAVNARSNVRR